MKGCLLDSQEHKFPEMDLFGEWRVTGFPGAYLAKITQALQRPLKF